MCGTTARQTRYGATRLTSMTRRQTSGLSSHSGALPPVMPALLTRMSILPASPTRAAPALGQRCRGLAERRRVDVPQRNRGARRQHLLRGRKADAPGAAGDDRRAAFEIDGVHALA